MQFGVYISKHLHRIQQRPSSHCKRDVRSKRVLLENQPVLISSVSSVQTQLAIARSYLKKSSGGFLLQRGKAQIQLGGIRRTKGSCWTWSYVAHSLAPVPTVASRIRRYSSCLVRGPFGDALTYHPKSCFTHLSLLGCCPMSAV
jgi:hypothetical protein